MAYTFKLRPVAGTIPFQEVDVSTRVGPYEPEPDDYDAKARDTSGRLTRVLRAMGRRFVLPDLMPLTESEVEILKRWKMDRTRVCLSPNWNANTVLYARYARLNLSGLPDSAYGPSPTFTRSTASTNASATQKRADGRYELLAADKARFEASKVTSGFSPMHGLRIFGRHNNYFGQSHPKSGALIFTLNNPSTNASWSWNANLPRVVTDFVQGAGQFYGDSGDNLQASVTPPAGQTSIGVWVIGEGTFSLKLTGGAVLETSNTALTPNVWTLLRLENVTASGAAVTVQLFSRATPSWCAVSAIQCNAGRRLAGYTHNVTNTTVYQVDKDDLYYDLQMPIFSPTIYIGLEMPDLWATGGEQCILGLDQTGGNRFVLRYDVASNKFSFQKKTSTAKIEWTPERSSGQGTVIALVAGKDFYFAYENGNFKGTTAGAAHSIPRGLHVGWDGVAGNEASGWGGLVYFLRVDQAPLDPTEIAYVSSLYNDSLQLNWTRWAEGRIFEIATPVHRMESALNFSALELEQVDHIYGATHEVP